GGAGRDGRGLARVAPDRQRRVEANGRPYLATEFVDGEPITDFCDRRRLGVNDRLALFTEVCDAVAFAHARLVVHRDLKPSNVLVAALEGETRVKLLDFGIAKLLQDDSGVRTQTGKPLLTPAYAAPEQLEGGPITTATDVYGLGVLLYELLTGTRPQPGGDVTRPSDAVTARAPTGGRVPPDPAGPVLEDDLTLDNRQVGAANDTGALRSTTMDRLRRRLRGDVDRIVLKALRTDPERRYRGAAELGTDIRRHLDGMPIAARPESRAYRVTKFVRRNRALVATAALALVAVLGGAGAALWQAAEAERQRDAAEAEVANFVDGIGAFSAAFDAANPSRVGSDTMRASVMLDRLVASVDTMENQRTRAALSGALAGVYLNRGKFQLAERLSARAVSMPTTTLPPVLALRLDHLATLGTARNMIGRPAEAAEPLREALGILETLGREESYYYAYVQGELGKVLKASGASEEGIEALQQAAVLARHLDTAKDTPEAERWAWLSSRAYADLGAALWSVERTDEARVAIDQGYAISQEPGRDAAASVIERYRTYVLLETGEYEAVVEMLTPGIAAHRGQYGAEHIEGFRLRMERAKALSAMGRSEGVEELLEVVAAYRNAYSADSPLSGIPAATLADALVETDRAQALDLYREALRLLDDGDRPRESAIVALRLARALSEGGDPDAARPFAQRAQEAFENLGMDRSAAEAAMLAGF
ncbi:protein kinase domain-containing protein, partial [Rubrivirga sp.]|uniref:serine/threonine-protein kinase n=1 Tax=Rubrivirga sp. TaxID=1885344 RepID=UPI003C753AD7